jgi:hypothetical protein
MHREAVMRAPHLVGRALVAVACALLAAIACVSNQTPGELRAPSVIAPPEGEGPKARGGGPRSFEEIERFSEAICSRERRCGNVGPAGRYASRTECVGAVSEDASHELTGCSPGLTTRLMGCAQVLEDQPCEDASTPAPCRIATLCSP